MKKILMLIFVATMAMIAYSQQTVVIRRTPTPRPTYGSIVVNTMPTTYTVQHQLNVVDYAGQKIPADIYDEYRKGKICAGTGATFTIIGVLAAVGGGLLYCSDMFGKQITPFDKQLGIGLMAGGGTFLAIGIPLCAYGNHAKKDFRLYYGQRIIR